MVLRFVEMFATHESAVGSATMGYPHFLNCTSHQPSRVAVVEADCDQLLRLQGREIVVGVEEATIPFLPEFFPRLIELAWHVRAATEDGILLAVSVKCDNPCC
jgi:hypothetical protein